MWKNIQYLRKLIQDCCSNALFDDTCGFPATHLFLNLLWKASITKRYFFKVLLCVRIFRVWRICYKVLYAFIWRSYSIIERERKKNGKIFKWRKGFLTCSEWTLKKKKVVSAFWLNLCTFLCFCTHTELQDFIFSWWPKWVEVIVLIAS